MIFVVYPQMILWLLQLNAPGGAVEEIRKLDPLIDVQWWIVGALIFVIGYLEKLRRDHVAEIKELRKEIDHLRDNTIRDLQAKLDRYDLHKGV